MAQSTQIDKFESMDFCYDILDYLNENGIDYINYFLQSTSKNINKVQVTNSEFDENTLSDIIPKLIKYTISNLKIGSSGSANEFINKNLEKIKIQGFQYVLMLIQDEKLEVCYNIKTVDSLTYTVNVLNTLPIYLLKTSQEDGLNEEETDENNE